MDMLALESRKSRPIYDLIQNLHQYYFRSTPACPALFPIQLHKERQKQRWKRVEEKWLKVASWRGRVLLSWGK